MTDTNTPPVAKDVYYDEIQFPINSPPREISFGRKPSELATDKETALQASNFRITKVSVNGQKRSGKNAGIAVGEHKDLIVNLDLNKSIYQPYKFAMRPVDVRVEFRVEDDEGLIDTGSFTFQVKHAEFHKEKTIRGTKGSDKIIANYRNNSILGRSGDDVINGMSGDDTINGGIGYDLIQGGEGNDILIGGKGDDEIRSGQGRDVLIGGAGRDMFVIGQGVNKIRDFDYPRDSVLIEISSKDEISRITNKGGDLKIHYPLGRLIVLNADRDQFLESLLVLEDMGQ